MGGVSDWVLLAGGIGIGGIGVMLLVDTLIDSTPSKPMPRDYHIAAIGSSRRRG